MALCWRERYAFLTVILIWVVDVFQHGLAAKIIDSALEHDVDLFPSGMNIPIVNENKFEV
jgi:hypothetical protein